MRSVFVLTLTGVVCVVAGCSSGEKLIKVKGTITQKKQVLPVGNGGLTVMFVPLDVEEKKRTSLPASYDKKTGEFTVPGLKGDGIAPGKYKVALTVMLATPSPDLEALNTRFSKANSPVVIEVKDEEPLSIELDQFRK